MSDKETTQIDFPSKFDDAQKAIKALKSTMDEEASSLFEERKEFEEMRKKLDSVHFEKHIKLNVGGLIFKTSLDTLVKDSDSMLAAMFSSRFDVKPDEEDGACFIDRDGTNFRYILNYLRTGKLIFPKENKVLARELYLEAEFYQISDIQKEIWPGTTLQNSSHIVNTLTDEQRNALLSWLPVKEMFMNWVQLYSCTTNGWQSSYVHQNCDNKGPTLVIAKYGNYVFGGYAQVSWNSKSGFVKDEKAFLFTLVNPTGAPPTKLPQTGDSNAGIWCHANYGAGFGSANGCTIAFPNNSNANSANCTIGDAYCGFVCPGEGALSTFISGSTSFNMNYFEVFGLKEA